MKALTVRQPWASLIVHGPKWIETRTRRTNVRGRIGIIAGKRAIDMVEVLTIRGAIVAASSEPKFMGLLDAWYDDQSWLCRNGHSSRVILKSEQRGDLCLACQAPLRMVPPEWGTKDLPLGALIGTVELYDCVPIMTRCGEPPHVCVASSWTCVHSPLHEPWYDGETEHDGTGQLPYGDFTPGRWAWLLRDPQPCNPVPMRGALGWQEIDR